MLAQLVVKLYFFNCVVSNFFLETIAALIGMRKTKYILVPLTVQRADAQRGEGVMCVYVAGVFVCTMLMVFCAKSKLKCYTAKAEYISQADKLEVD